MSSGYPFSLEPLQVPPVETAYRRIATELPAPDSVPLLHRLLRCEPRSMAIDQLPVVWDRAEGFQVSDAYGNRWIDFTSGIFVANVGHGHPAVVAAVRGMLDRPLLHNYCFPSEIRGAFVEKLVSMAPRHLDTALLLTTGSETTECAIKLIRIHGSQRDPRKRAVVSLAFAFHGKTMGAQQAGGRASAKAWIGTLDPRIHQMPVPLSKYCPHGSGPDHECGAGCFHQSLRVLEQDGVDLSTIAGFLLEPYQGWSAAFLPDAYVHALRAWATSHDALVAFDEVQSGFGRTGKLFAHEYFGVEADLVCCGKGIASGLPLSAVLGRRAVIDIDPSLNSTHGGNPVACAAGLATLRVLEREQLVERAAALAEPVGRELQAIAARHPRRIQGVYGRGLVWALHLIDPDTGALDVEASDRVTERAMHKGVLTVRTGVGTIKLGPPLCIPEDAVVEGIRALGETIDELWPERRKV